MDGGIIRKSLLKMVFVQPNNTSKDCRDKEIGMEEKKINGKILDGYILPENAEVKEIDVKMWSNGISTFAYQDKRSAVYSCAIGTVCECGKQFEGNHYIYCPECRGKRTDEKYNKLDLVEWDGETPLCLFDGDEFFYSPDDVESYIDSNNIECELQLVLCREVYPQDFCLNDFVEDHLPEDFGIDDLENEKQKYSAGEIEKIVNDYLKALSPVWYPSNKRVKYTP